MNITRMITATAPATRGGGWETEAKCVGKDPQLFELDEARGHGDEVHARIASGLRVCTSCPVRAACYNSASEVDKYWTTRGGRPPEGLFADSKIAYSPSAGKIRRENVSQPRRSTPADTCKYGHNDWKPRASSPGKNGGSGTRYCATCLDLRNKRRYDKSITLEG